MRRTLMGWAVAGLVCCSAASLAQTLPPGPYDQDHGKRVMTSADGGVCRALPSGWRCRQFVVQRNRLETGEIGETRARVDYWGNSADGWYWRTIECPVTRGVLRVVASAATVDALLDPAAEGCFTEGERVTNEPYSSEPWPFVTPVILQVSMLDPGIENRWVSNHTQEYHADGITARELCRGHSGYSLRGGELRVGALGEAIVTGRFSEDDTEGSFYDDRCERLDRTPSE